MLSIDRQKYIMEYLHKKETVTSGELAQKLNVTLMTIGRDLKILEKQGFLVRSYGGAVLPDRLAEEKLYTRKKEEHLAVKKRIAAEAMKEIHSGMTLVLDAGTTTFEIADLLKKSSLKNLTVITDDLYIAIHLYQKKGIQVIMLGGEILAETGASIGGFSIQQLQHYNADISFIGSSSITEDFYLTVPTETKVFLKQTMTQIGAKKVLIADKSKFGSKKLYKVSSLSTFDLVITDYVFTPDVLKRLGLEDKIKSV